MSWGPGPESRVDRALANADTEGLCVLMDVCGAPVTCVLAVPTLAWL